jgi:phosphoglycerate dehydrogenase-like enzyme
MLPSGVIVREVPAGPLPPTLGHGDFLAADYNVARVREIIPRLDGLRVVQSPAAGVDALLDVIPAGVTLCDGAGIHDAPVAEWVVMALLAMAHNLPGFVQAQTRGEWHRTGPAAGGDDLEGSTVLIVGHGSIGRAVEARLTPFGVKFLRVARHPREGTHSLTDLPTLLPQADIVVILLPLTSETRKLVDDRFFSAMRPGALFVNPARGAIVDTEALTAALTAGRIRAALDVTDPEPLPKGHPLWSARGVLITPHIAGSVTKVFDRAWALIADQVRRFSAGEPLRNVVVDGY